MYVCSLPLVEAGTEEKGELSVDDAKASPSASGPGPVPKLARALANGAGFANTSAGAAALASAAPAAPDARLCLVLASSELSSSFDLSASSCTGRPSKEMLLRKDSAACLLLGSMRFRVWSTLGCFICRAAVEVPLLVAAAMLRVQRSEPPQQRSYRPRIQIPGLVLLSVSASGPSFKCTR